MIIENLQTFNFEGALRGMRNPMASWDKSDSGWFWEVAIQCNKDVKCEYKIGPKDMELALRLIHGGPEHRKFLRQIFVSMDITAPLYWWKEMDTYKLGTTANSTSTMHKLASTPITLDCFEIDDYDKNIVNEIETSTSTDFVTNLVNHLEELRQKYLETKDKRYWKELIRWLPESWLQTRTWTGNYENLRNIVHQRENHKLSEWHTYIDALQDLPYSKEFIFDN